MEQETLTKKQNKIFYLGSVCFIATLGGLLFGYDTAVISGAIGFLQQKYSLSPAMVGWAASCALAGCIFGAMFAGVLSDGIGRKKALVIAAILFAVSALGTAIPRNMTEFIIFRIIGGVGVGIASMVGPIYIAEISPAHLRGRMVSFNQFAIVSGILVVYFVNLVIARQGDLAWNIERGWRYMFGSELVPAMLFLALLFLVPESPRWLTEKNREEAALRILSKVGGVSHAQSELNEIKASLNQEETSLMQLFEPGMRIVLLIGVALAVLQQVTGINAFLYYAPEIFKKAGSAADSALVQTVVLGIANMAATIAAIWTVDKLGRKPLLLIGATGMFICLAAFGTLSYFQITGAYSLVFVVGYIACFAMSLGPVVWVVLSEIFPTKIRGRAMSIATLSLWLANWIISQTFPMLAENQWLVQHFHNAFVFWLFAIMCIVTIVFVIIWVPETKGKSLESISAMWHKKKV